MRNYDDIPEPFRRALEEAGWGNSGDEGGEGGRPPRPALRPWWRNRAVWIFGLILLLFLSLNWITVTYTDWLWFGVLGYQPVWLRRWSYQIGSFLLFFLVAAVILWGNWHLARRRALRTGRTPFLRQLPGLSLLTGAAALFFAYVFAQTGASQWNSFLRYVYRTPFGVADPIFNLDIGFYLFELPVYEFVRGWLAFLIVITLIGVGIIYTLGNATVAAGGRFEVAPSLPGLRPHLAALGTGLLLLWAVGHWFDLYELLYSPRGVVFGASYTDLNAQRFALYTQFGLMLLVAVAVAFNIFRYNWRLPAIAGLLWLVVSIGLGGIYPGLLQRYSVEPNEIARERPFIEHNINYTRLAFDLNDVNVRPFTIGRDLTATDISNEVALQNVRVWDYRPLQATYAQLQGLRPYYQFGEIDIDRYVIDGQVRQVMLGARELDKSKLPSQTWVNEKLVFTHGYGVVMNPVDLITRDGQPRFFIQDLPPQSTLDFNVEQPEVYYGELDGDVVYVGSGQEEFSYPVGNSNVTTSYTGAGGVPLSNLWRRLAFTVRFAETNLLLSQDITPATKVIFNRRVTERIRQIAPFLVQDADPYVVIVDGRLVWMVDAYTVSRAFPYSTPVNNIERYNGINYIRNSVKITVDAYDGTVNFYVADPQDPIIRTYDRAFPGLFQPLDAMPAGLREHIRYPEDLFTIQTKQYLIYHMTDVTVFYNQEDVWQIPVETLDVAQQPLEPYYVVLTLPGEARPEYLLIQPYTPAGKQNMIAWIAARNEGENYGQLVVYELPKQELVFGPSQIEARIDQDTAISQQISLWNQQGSRVIRGNLIVIPIANNFLYVEPLYLLAESSALPELKRVIVATGDRIAMEDNLGLALTSLLDEAVVAEGAGAVEVVAPGGETETEAGPATDQSGETPPVLATVAELIQSANARFAAAEAAQRAGDWATYGAELAGLEADLQQLMELTGATPAGVPAP